MGEGNVLCGANAARKKYYFNDAFASLPDAVKKELKAACVLFAENTGGTVLLLFTADGTLNISTMRDEDDILYDEIEAELQVRRLQKDKEELFRQLEEYYRVFFLSKR